MTPGRAAIQTLLAFAGMLGCVLAGLVLHIALGTQGRDPTIGASLAAVLLALLAAVCVRRGWHPAPLLIALALACVLAAALIGVFGYGGLPRPDRFFFSWFGGVGLILAVPWLVGMALGWRWARERPAKTPNPRR